MDIAQAFPSLSTPQPKPLIVGLYGISGSGKSHIINKLRIKPGNPYLIFDGSEMIDRVVPGGLSAFHAMESSARKLVREEAVSNIARECADAGKMGIVAGHYMFWDDEGSAEPERVGTQKDWGTYTHVVYLKTEPGVVQRYRGGDTSRERTELSVEHLRKWQELEVMELRKLCRQNWVMFATLRVDAKMDEEGVLDRFEDFLFNFRRTRTEEEADVGVEVDAAIASSHMMKTMLVLDADKTLAPVDTGAMFWSDEEAVARIPEDPHKAVFQSRGYTREAFQQAMLLHEEFSEEEFDAICERVASKVDLFPEMEKLLKNVAEDEHVGAMVVTCGLRGVWEKVLERYGCPHVELIAGGRLDDPYMVTDVTKEYVVGQLHKQNVRVVAFGDSPLDIPMLEAADEAYVVVCNERVRSNSMNWALTTAINDSRLSAVQVVLPEGCSHRLNLDKIPKVTLDKAEQQRILHIKDARDRILHATEKTSAKLLMTPTRDAAYRGPALREAHERVGEYLATEYLSDLLGLEEIEIQHVQGRATSGHRVRDETATLIIPAMRGGEAMAFGVSKVLPRASFVHARNFGDIDLEHFEGRRSILLVDSVVNTGESMVEDFIKPIRAIRPYARIVVVAGVVQANALKDTGAMMQLLEEDVNLYVVALCESQNSYKGQGTTDTGDRLFNTTYM
ncbi:hypothetical protein NX059_011922 [Plenodomus lindquistii]|nr:hypothetical protein NX059_011922 [Plenodomus lindquistii]